MAWVPIVNGETGLLVSNKLDTAFGSLETRATNLENQKADKIIEVLRASSSQTPQEPSATGEAIQINFGAVQNKTQVLLDSDGSFTIKEAGTYSFQIRFQVGRTGSVGTSLIYIRPLINGLETFPPSAFKLSSDDTLIPYTCIFEFALNVDDVVSFQLIRDSAGHNSGGLYCFPSSHGWASATPASVILFKKG